MACSYSRAIRNHCRPHINSTPSEHGLNWAMILGILITLVISLSCSYAETISPSTASFDMDRLVDAFVSTYPTNSSTARQKEFFVNVVNAVTNSRCNRTGIRRVSRDGWTVMCACTKRVLKFQRTVSQFQRKIIM